MVDVVALAWPRGTLEARDCAATVVGVLELDGENVARVLRVMLAPEDRSFTSERVEELMGRRPELRFRFIQENAGRIAAEALDA